MNWGDAGSGWQVFVYFLLLVGRDLGPAARTHGERLPEQGLARVHPAGERNQKGHSLGSPAVATKRAVRRLNRKT